MSEQKDKFLSSPEDFKLAPKAEPAKGAPDAETLVEAAALLREQYGDDEEGYAAAMAWLAQNADALGEENEQ